MIRKLISLVVDQAHSIAAMATIIVIAQFFFIALPSSNRIAKVNAEIAAYRKAQAKAQETLTTLGQLQSLDNQQSDDLARLRLALPDNPAIQDIYITIDSITARTGVTVLSVTPNPVAADKIPVTLTLSGSYEGLVAFMSTLNRNLRPVEIESLGVASSFINNTVTLTGTMKLNFFYVSSQENKIQAGALEGKL